MVSTLVLKQTQEVLSPTPSTGGGWRNPERKQFCLGSPTGNQGKERAHVSCALKTSGYGRRKGGAVSPPRHRKRISREGGEGEGERVCAQRQGEGDQRRVRKKVSQDVQPWENEARVTQHYYLA